MAVVAHVTQFNVRPSEQLFELPGSLLRIPPRRLVPVDIDLGLMTCLLRHRPHFLRGGPCLLSGLPGPLGRVPGARFGLHPFGGCPR